jgi:hypothetical protein
MKQNKSIRQAVNQAIESALQAGLVDTNDFIKGRYHGQKSDLVEFISSSIENLGFTRETVRSETVGVYLRTYRRQLKRQIQNEVNQNN